MIMRNLSIALALALVAPAWTSAQQPQPTPPAQPAPPATVVEGVDFRVYDHRGRARSFADVLAAMDEADALLVGETHTDVVGHGVEAQIFVRAAERMGAGAEGAAARRAVVLSLEMFERDVQYVLDEYMGGLITEDLFKKSARPWERYDTDYRPMVEYAREHGLSVVAANAPRRYVNRVSRLGPASLDQLSGAGKAFLPPLPYPGPSEAYAEKWNALMADTMSAMRTPPDSAAAPRMPIPPPQAPPSEHGVGNALYAQALWDAAMGHAVATALDEVPGALVVHYVGSFHVGGGTGIPERIRDYRPRTRSRIVFLQPASDVNVWNDEEYRDLGDFVILTKRPPEIDKG
jgi:uncharacterized iron-regulated protein